MDKCRHGDGPHTGQRGQHIGEPAGFDVLQGHGRLGPFQNHHEAGRAQLRIVGAEQATPQPSLMDLHQLTLQRGQVVFGQIDIAQGLNQAVVTVAGLAHHDAQRAIVLHIDIAL